LRCGGLEVYGKWVRERRGGVGDGDGDFGAAIGWQELGVVGSLRWGLEVGRRLGVTSVLLPPLKLLRCAIAPAAFLSVCFD
jgi:hypothetical protein